MPEIRTPALRHTRGAFGAGRDDNPGKISTCNQVNRILLSRASKKKREKERERELHLICHYKLRTGLYTLLQLGHDSKSAGQSDP
jgi:hypothetical protein